VIYEPARLLVTTAVTEKSLYFSASTRDIPIEIPDKNLRAAENHHYQSLENSPPFITPPDFVPLLQLWYYSTVISTRRKTWAFSTNSAAS
jgi:hypothetical protein